jgi:hypothetical protein
MAGKYVIGSYYIKDEKNYYQDMLELNVISMGYAYDEGSLEKFYGKPDEVKKYLKKHGHDKRPVSALKLFMQLNEGDMIAIKRDGQPRKGKKNNLIICGYAVVTSRNGKFYGFDEDVGHTINVKHLLTNLNKDIVGLSQAYQWGMHKVKADDISKIFDKAVEKSYKNESMGA